MTLRSAPRWIAAIVSTILLAVGCITAAWTVRYTLAVRRLTRGVGDTIFFAADGRPWFRLDEQRRDVPLDQISPHLRQAIIAVEDHRFYRHPGIDPIALARAAVENVSETDVVQGGSTLTQQLARTLFLSNTRTYGRKIKEAALALLLEAQLTKNQILELFLNRVYLSAGVYGVEGMSQKLFGKPSRALTLAESAVIAGLIRAPSALSPWSNLEGAVRRSHVVLARMRQERFITPELEEGARRARLRVQPYPGPADARGAYAKEFLRQQFRERFGGDHPPDWQVHTTFLPELQDSAERAVASGLARLGVPDLHAALVALDPRTGDLLALVGGRDFRTAPFNRATRSRRQPGSAFKPLVYAVALEQGLSPVSVLTGLSAIRAEGPEREAEWTPTNASGETPDELTLRAALVESNNLAAVALQQRVGSRPVLRLARSLGIRELPDVPSLALGTGLVTPLELTAAYAVFPNGGFFVRPRALTRVLDAHGSQVLDVPVARDRVLSELTAYQMVTLLRDVIERGTGSAARSHGIRFAAGGKTGTTDDFKDAWFVGFSSVLVAGVWVGFDQPATIGPDAYGARVALPIWSDFMRRASRRWRPGAFAVPAGLAEHELCRVSYLRPVEECPTYIEYLKEQDRAPDRLCPLHRGSLRQRAERAIGGFFSGLGKRLKGIFRR